MLSSVTAPLRATVSYAVVGYGPSSKQVAVARFSLTALAHTLHVLGTGPHRSTLCTGT